MDREAGWPGLASSDRPGGEAAVQGQGGSLARPPQAVIDMLKKLQSRNREAA